jgi:hypothetical protein
VKILNMSFTRQTTTPKYICIRRMI